MGPLKKLRKNVSLITAIGAAGILLIFPALASQDSSSLSHDEEYTKLIREATTLPEFLSPLVNYLPKAEGVPTPKDVLGYIAGAPGKLTYYADILRRDLTIKKGITVLLISHASDVFLKEGCPELHLSWVVKFTKNTLVNSFSQLLLKGQLMYNC